MSVKGVGQTLYIGRNGIRIKEFPEKDIRFGYDGLVSIEYQYADNSRYGFLRFKLDVGNIHTFCFRRNGNEPVSRAIPYIKNYAPGVVMEEKDVPFSQKERYGLWSVKKKVLLFVLTFFIFFVIFFELMESFVSINHDDIYITLDEYKRCETGMTYEQCVKIIGSEGEPLVESSILDSNLTAYVWYGDAVSSGSAATLYFMNGKLYTEAQIGLD